MRDEDDSYARLPVHPLWKVQDLRAHRDIELRHRIVGHDEPWTDAQRAGDGDTFELPAGALVRVAGGMLGVQTDPPRQPARLLGDPVRRADPAQPRRQRARAADREALVEGRERILEHHLQLAPEGRPPRRRQGG
ncbi:MAG: hypothetical protein NZM27_02580 [Acetobacteraceae bacterium]|nr:hypothetical protein [Acetobacteraceae bacterium]MDW8398818.1 hypothetical protein [Acetobacteraceae bacterium]